MHAYWRVSRGLTVGVRAAVSAARRGVPGAPHLCARLAPAGRRRRGGRDGARCLGARARRGGQHHAQCKARAVRHLFNTLVSRRDHVVLFVVRDFSQASPRGARPRDCRDRLLPACSVAGGRDGRRPRGASPRWRRARRLRRSGGRPGMTDLELHHPAGAAGRRRDHRAPARARLRAGALRAHRLSPARGRAAASSTCRSRRWSAPSWSPRSGSRRPSPARVPALVLGPIAVEPAFERRGIAAALVRRALDSPATTASSSSSWSATSPITAASASSRCRPRP